MGGACITGNSLIALLNGSFKSIKEIVAEKKIKQIPCIDIHTGKQVKGNIIQYCDVGYAPTIKITLESSREIEGTYDHPVIIIKNNEYKWIKLNQLAIGDTIAIASELPYFGSYNNKNAYLTGLLIGNKTYNKGITSVNNELLNYINNYNIQNLNSDKIESIIKSANIYDPITSEKTLPSCWQEYNKESLQNLISGLFDACGNFSIDKDNITISITFANKKIINDIQLILQKFSINAIIKTDINAKDNINIWILIIKDKKNIKAFFNNFKLLKHNTKDILDIINKYKITFDTDLCPEKVIKIKYIKEKQHVYDLTVDKYHSFIANGIYVHNTNAKIIKIGTPKSRNHFYDSVEGPNTDYYVIRSPWDKCEQLWKLAATYLPDHEHPENPQPRPYSTYVLSLMPKAIKMRYWPNNPEIWDTGSNMTVPDFETQYMLCFISDSSSLLSQDQFSHLTLNGDFDWLEYGSIDETYVAGIDFGQGTGDLDPTAISVLRINHTNNRKEKVFGCELRENYPQQIKHILEMFTGPRPRFKVAKICSDFSGVGRGIVQMLISQGLNMIGIIFNARDTLSNKIARIPGKTRMTFGPMTNFKTSMYNLFILELENDRFSYPKKERMERLFLSGTPAMQQYHQGLAEWNDMQINRENEASINPKIYGTTHDDIPSSDVLALYASFLLTQNHKMPSGSTYRTSR